MADGGAASYRVAPEVQGVALRDGSHPPRRAEVQLLPLPATFRKERTVPYKDLRQQREFQRRWIADQRAEYLADKACVDCGSREALEIDHIDRTSKTDHRIWSWSAERREGELAKCVVRCHACHVRKTNAIDRRKVEHGTVWMYTSRNCRCEPCRRAKAASKAAWREKKRAAARELHGDFAVRP